MQNYNPQMGYPTTGQAPIATQYPYGVIQLAMADIILEL